MRRTALVIAAQLVAFWPIGRWYAGRVADAAEGAWGLLALATVVPLVWRARRAGAREARIGLLLPTLLLLVYALTYALFPPLLRAAVAVTAVGATLSAAVWRRRFHPGVMGLLYLSLPLIPSLQFYGGYPLRVFVAGAAAPLLRLGGFAVMQEGACLDWAGQLIWVDAPCSGIRMLWAGLYLACALACLLDLRALKTLLALGAALVAIILGNVVRAVALFYLEAGVLEGRAWAHEYVGVIAFALVAACVTAFVGLLRREGRCEAPSPTSAPAC